MIANKVIFLSAAVLLGLLIVNNATFAPSIGNSACRSTFIANYTAALATYGSKAKVITNPFYQGNSTCYLECIIKVAHTTVASLGVIEAPDFMPCSNGVNNKFTRRNSQVCVDGECVNIATVG